MARNTTRRDHLWDLIGYPFPLASGGQAWVYLPWEGTTHADAARLWRMVDSLVMDDEQPVLSVEDQETTDGE